MNVQTATKAVNFRFMASQKTMIDRKENDGKVVLSSIVKTGKEMTAGQVFEAVKVILSNIGFPLPAGSYAVNSHHLTAGLDRKKGQVSTASIDILENGGYRFNLSWFESDCLTMGTAMILAAVKREAVQNGQADKVAAAGFTRKAELPATISKALEPLAGSVVKVPGMVSENKLAVPLIEFKCEKCQRVNRFNSKKTDLIKTGKFPWFCSCGCQIDSDSVKAAKIATAAKLALEKLEAAKLEAAKLEAAKLEAAKLEAAKPIQTTGDSNKTAKAGTKKGKAA